MVDPLELAEAKHRTTPPSIGDVSFGDWAVAVSFHLLTMLIAAAFRLAPPITEREIEMVEAERLAAIRKERAARGAATRRKNQEKKAPRRRKKAKKAANIHHLFSKA
jgi:hypothetical protein